MPQDTNTTPPKPRNRFDYFFRDKPEALAELKRLGIRFEAVRVDAGVLWPGFILPSGHALLIACDDEGNGAGAVHVLNPDQLV